jgi:hypothetical protein
MVASGNAFLDSLFGIQFVTGFLGFLLIAAGIFMFKPVRDIVVTTGRTTAKVASKAGEVAAAS